MCFKVKECAIDYSLSLVNAGLSTIGPTGIVLGNLIQSVVEHAVPDKFSISLKKIEEQRMNLFFEKSVSKIEQNLKAKKTLRNDDIYYSPTELEIPKVQEIFEGLMQKVRYEHQSQKVVFYSNFFANLCFDETISLDHAFFLMQIIEKLSYRQFAILKYMSDNRIVNSSPWDSKFKAISELGRYYDFYAEYTDLYNLKLISQNAKKSGYSLGMSDTCISVIGSHLVSLTELDSIPQKDCVEIDYTINAIKAIIDRNI